MTISFNVNQKALSSLGNKALSFIDSFDAIKIRCGAGIEASSSVYPTMSFSCLNSDYEDYFKITAKRISEKEMSSDKKNKLNLKLNSEFKRIEEEGFSHPFVEAVHIAYSKHYPLLITPDSVWLCLAQGFANHINLNSDILRDKFVKYDGKKLILIERDDFKKGSSTNDWQDCFKQFSDKIGEEIGDKKDLLISNFSTTGPIEKTASEIVLMDCVKSYFKFAVRTLCGIPRITLSGTIQDWENIYLRVVQFSEYGLDWWVKPLLPILTKLVETSEGNPDINFWNCFYKQIDGSGGPYASGWINVLFPYIQKYDGDLIKNVAAEQYTISEAMFSGPTLNSFPNGFSKIPFKWQHYGTTYDMEFLGGMFGIHQDRSTLEVVPNIGWAVKDLNSSKVGPINPNEIW